jgi:hypothetical protein
MSGDAMNQMASSQQINSELRKKEAAGSYSNFTSIRHSPAGLFRDFARIIIESQRAKSLFDAVSRCTDWKEFLRHPAVRNGG